MANRILNMVFKADTRDAKSAMDDLEGKEGQPGGVLGLKGALQGLVTPATIAVGAIGSITAIVSNEINKYNDYVTEVGNLGQSLGLAAEDASFLASAMDRYEISNDTMVAVFRKLSSEGIDPTVENLGKLLEQWEAMPEGAEKGQFAMEMFGEQGIKQILPWYEKLTEAQKESFGVQENGLEVTQDMIEQSWEYKMAVADLKDQWTLFKVELLTGIIPALTTVLNILTNTKTAIDQFFGGASGKGVWDVTIGNLFSSPEPPAAPAMQSGPNYEKFADRYGYATGGNFVVGGGGGPDQTRVSFMATPGETVSVGGGSNDMQQVLAEMRRLVNTLPTVLTDSLERM